MSVAILVVLACVVVLLLLVLRRPQTDAGSALLQQQLVELRGRLDALAEAQRGLPLALADGHADQLKVLADLRDRLGQLSESTRRLENVGVAVTEVQDLLKVPKLRGTLGEVWLEELLRQVFPESQYVRQHRFRSGDIVDIALRIGERLVPVDAKFPLESFQRMMAGPPEAAERERRAFRRTLKERIDEIADKYIRPDEGTYDFALLYIPAENVYYEAIVRGDDLADPDSVVGYALGRRVIPVSPHTFYAYLAAVLHGLRGLRVEERARQILDSLAGLQQDFDRFAEAFRLVGRHLDSARKQYGESDKQIEAIRDSFAEITGVEDAVALSTAPVAVPARDAKAR